MSNKDSCVEAGIDFIYSGCKLGGRKYSAMQHKSKAIKQGVGKNEKKSGIGIWKGEREDTQTYKIKMSIMQSCNCKTTEIYWERCGKNREGGRKGTIRFLTSLTSYKLHGVFS